MRTISVGIDDRDMVAIEAEAREKKTAPEAIAGLKIKDAMRRGVVYAEYPQSGTIIYKSAGNGTRRGVVVATAGPTATPNAPFKRKRWMERWAAEKKVQVLRLPVGAELKVFKTVKALAGAKMTSYSLDGVVSAKEVTPSRADRKAALMKLRELWNADPANPIDGVEYQKAMRAEWQ